MLDLFINKNGMLLVNGFIISEILDRKVGYSNNKYCASFVSGYFVIPTENNLLYNIDSDMKIYVDIFKDRGGFHLEIKHPQKTEKSKHDIRLNKELGLTKYEFEYEKVEEN